MRNYREIVLNDKIDICDRFIFVFIMTQIDINSSLLQANNKKLLYLY